MNSMNTTSGIQTLKLTGLRFSANLGILESEKLAPQPIEVNAELGLGAQPLLPHDDDIGHVLDYRKVRQIITNECTSEHVNLLESLIGKVGQKVAKGDPLLSMEAMKMETMLSAEREAVVHAIHVRAGETVNAEDLLVELTLSA